MPRDFFLFVCTCVYHVLNWQLQTFMHLSYNLVVWSLIWALRLLCKQNQKEPSWKHPRKCPSKWICCLAFALLLFVKQSSEIQFDLFNYLFSVDFIRQIAEFKWRNESKAFAKFENDHSAARFSRPQIFYQRGMINYVHNDFRNKRIKSRTIQRIKRIKIFCLK